MRPGIAATTVVVPGPVGLKATPPVATVVGENDVFAGIVTVRDWPGPPVVVSCATAALLLVTVAVKPALPVRTF